MARTDEAEWWFNAVYAAVQEIPTGYGPLKLILRSKP